MLIRQGRPIPSPPLLRDRTFLARIRKAGALSIRRFHRTPTRANFLRQSEAFTDAMGLASPSLRKLFEVARSPGLSASQAMFGQVAFLIPKTPSGRSELRRVAATSKPGDALLAQIGRRGAGLLTDPDPGLDAAWGTRQTVGPGDSRPRAPPS